MHYHWRIEYGHATCTGCGEKVDQDIRY